jgi:hypothetical protein
MTGPTQVNCRKHRQTYRAKGADRLRPKRYAVRLLVFSMQAHGPDDCRCSRQGLTHPMLVERNMVNPSSRLVEAGDSARSAIGMADRGCWKKPTPSCNRADRSGDITSPRKRADFQRVERDENAGRTFVGGNCR